MAASLQEPAAPPARWSSISKTAQDSPNLCRFSWTGLHFSLEGGAMELDLARSTRERACRFAVHTPYTDAGAQGTSGREYMMDRRLLHLRAGNLGLRRP